MELESGQAAHVHRYVADGPQTVIDFITLNYSDVLEKVFPNRGRPTVRPDYAVRTIQHIHGTYDKRISLGVNDESQISSYIDTEEKAYLIKPELIRIRNDGRIERLEETIFNSQVVVLFGVSMGDTDKYIWKKVADWLLAYTESILVIHDHEDGRAVDDLTEREASKLEERVKNKFLSHASLTDDQKISLKRKIYVVPNTKLLFHTDPLSIKK